MTFMVVRLWGKGMCVWGEWEHGGYSTDRYIWATDLGATVHRAVALEGFNILFPIHLLLLIPCSVCCIQDPVSKSSFRTFPSRFTKHSE